MPPFSQHNVTFPCSNLHFESLSLQCLHHISLGRPIKAAAACHRAYIIMHHLIWSLIFQPEQCVMKKKNDGMDEATESGGKDRG